MKWPYTDKGNSVTTDPSGNILTCGHFVAVADFDSDSSTLMLTSEGLHDVFIHKSNSVGELVWCLAIGGTENDVAKDIRTDANGNIYVTGFFEGTVDFDPGASTHYATANGAKDIFVLKLDSLGNFSWVQTFGSSLDDEGISLDINSSGVFITGYFQQTVDFDPGSGITNKTSAGKQDVFILRLSFGGSLNFIQTLGGSDEDLAHCVSITSTGSVLITGSYTGSVDFNPGSGTALLSSYGGHKNAFIELLNANGTFIWVKSLDGSLDIGGKSITSDPLGNILVTGYFAGSADLDPGQGNASHTSIGLDDVFVVKLSSSGNYIWSKTFGSYHQYDTGNDIISDSNGNIYIVGAFGSWCDFDPGPANETYGSLGYLHGFIEKLDSAGNYIRVVPVGGQNMDEVSCITLDSSDNPITTGLFGGSANFGTPYGGNLQKTSSGTYDIFIQKITSSGALIWAQTLGGSLDGSHSRGLKLHVSRNQNIYLSGMYAQVADLDLTSSVDTVFSTFSKRFLSKLDHTGATLWKYEWLDYEVHYLTTDSSENLYALGVFSGTVDMDPGSGVYNLTSQGGFDAFIQKLDPQGNLLWTFSIGSLDSDGIGQLHIDTNGDLIVRGAFQDTPDFDPGPGSAYLTAIDQDNFIAKYTSSGQFIWVKQLKGTGYGQGHGLALDQTNNVYCTGLFSGDIDLDPGSNVQLHTSNGLADIFIVKLNSNGQFVWGTSFGSSANESSTGVLVDQASNLIFGGTFKNTIDFDPGPGIHNLSAPNIGAYVLKLDSSGNFIWARKLDGTGSPGIRNMDLDDSANIILSGVFSSTVDFDPGPGTYNFTGLGAVDSYFAKLDSGGNFVWAKQLASSSGVNVQCMDLDSSQNIYSTGYYTYRVDFDPNLNDHYMEDFFTVGFVHKMFPCSNFASTPTITACDSYISPSGNLLNSSGTYYDTIPSTIGSDSIIITDLTITNSTYHSLTITDCPSYTSPSGNYVWTISGNYSDTLVNSAGCDSIIDIDLTIFSLDTTLNITSCNSYISPSGNHLWSSSGNYQDTLISSAGCDSIISVLLTVISPDSILTITACDSYTGPSGNSTWTTNGIYYDTIANSSGCNSVFIVYLDIVVIDTSVNVGPDFLTSNAQGSTYQWLDCNNGLSPVSGGNGQTLMPVSNGSYAVVVTDSMCSDTSACYTISQLAAPSTAAGNQVTCFPNPNKGSINVLLGSPTSGVLKIYNSLGKEVESFSFDAVNTITARVNGEPGLYILELLLEDAQYRTYIIKQ